MGVAAHVIADIDLRRCGGSALTGDSAVPKAPAPSSMTTGVLM